jgi:acetolactate synthase small subunit
MHVFHIRYRNTQGTLMRILTAASRRAIDTPYVQAEPCGHEHRVTLLMDVTQKQVGQLSRDWYAIVDVLDVHPAIAVQEVGEHTRAARNVAVGAPHPPAPAVLAGDGVTQQALA